MSNSRSQINSNFYQIANADPTCGNITGIVVGTVQATGNITAAYYFGNGSGLTGVTSSINYSNANVAAYLPTYTGNLASSSDIIALYANAVAQENEISALQAAQYSNANVANYLQVLTSNVTTTANISGAYILGNGRFLTGLPAGYSNADVANYLPTYTGNLASSSDIIALYANAAAQSNAIANLQDSSYSNANVANYLQVLTTNVTTTANVQASYLIGNIRNTTGGYNDTNVAAYLPTYLGNLQSGNLLVVNSAVIQGNLTVLGNTTTINANTLNINDKDITVANGALTAAEANGAGLIVGQGNLANIIFNNPANAWTLYPGVDTPGNISGSYILGNITQATGYIVYGNANVAAYLPTYTGNLSASSDIIALYANAATQANSIINIDSNIANLYANAATQANSIINIDSNIANLYANAATQSNAIANLQASAYSNANVAAYLPTYTGNLASSSDIIALYANAATQSNLIINLNSDIANLSANAGTQANAIANLQSNVFILQGNVVDINSNIANLYANAAAQSNAIANIVSNVTILQGNIITINSNIANLYANAATQSNAIANLQAAQYSNANVANYLPTYTGAVDSLTGNVTTTANVQAAYFIGNGSQLTGLPASYGNANVANYLQVLSSNVTTTANVQANYFIGNGYYLSGIQASNILGAYGNANVKTYLESGATINANFGGGNITTTGTANLGITQVNGNLVVTGNISATGNITYINVSDLVVSDPLLFLAANNPGDVEDIGLVANYNPGSGNLHTGFARDYTDSTWKVFQGVTSDPNTVVAWNEAVYAPFKAGSILSNASITANANVVATGNVSGTYILGNGYFLTGVQYGNLVGAYGNANVTNFLANGFGSNTITTTGNIQAGTVKGTNFQATTSAGGTLKNSSGTTQASWGAGGGDNFSVAVSTNLDGANAQIDISPTGTGHVHIKPTGTGAVEIAPTNIGSINNMVIGNVTPAAANVTTLGATGNVTAAYYFGNGSQLTGISSPYSNANVAAYLASNSNVIITTTGNITTSANVVTNTVIGPANTSTTITTNGFVWTFSTAGNLILPSNAQLQIQYANGTFVPLGYGNANVAAYLPTYTGALPSLTGNVTTTANVQGAYVLGNGAFLTGLPATYGNANVANYLPTYTGNISANNISVVTYLTVDDNITANYATVVFDFNVEQIYGGNAQFVETVSANNINITETIQANNAIITNDITATSNVTAAYYFGNGSQLTGIATTESFNPFLLAGM